MTKEEIINELTNCSNEAQKLQKEFMKEPDKAKCLIYLKRIRRLVKRVVHLKSLLEEYDPEFKSVCEKESKISLKNLLN